MQDPFFEVRFEDSCMSRMYPIEYRRDWSRYVKVLKTDQYDRWFRKLKDVEARAKINARIRRIQLANELVGDWKSVGGKVIELRVDCGPGYRVYANLCGKEFLLLLLGGDKSTQQEDIRKARALLEEWEAQGGCED